VLHIYIYIYIYIYDISRLRVKLYWHRNILTDKTVPFNRPDVTFMNKKTKNTFLIDKSVPNTHNLA